MEVEVEVDAGADADVGATEIDESSGLRRRGSKAAESMVIP